MRLVMIGGTGFLGYFTCRELLVRGHEVVAVGLDTPLLAPCRMAAMETCSDPDLAALRDGADAASHVSGADGRARRRHQRCRRNGWRTRRAARADPSRQRHLPAIEKWRST